MSAKATFWAWEQSVAKSSHKLVLLCLGDCHNADTGRCDPSVAYIAKKTQLDKKTVSSAIKGLADDNCVSVKRTRSSNQYEFNFDRINACNQVKIDNFVYKTSDIETGEFYIGCHSGSLDDQYMGSGNWVARHPSPENLRREILATFPTRGEVIGAEKAYISMFCNDSLCKNIDTQNTEIGSTEIGSTEIGITQKRYNPKTDTADTQNSPSGIPKTGQEPISKPKKKLTDKKNTDESIVTKEDIDKAFEYFYCDMVTGCINPATNKPKTGYPKKCEKPTAYKRMVKLAKGKTKEELVTLINLIESDIREKFKFRVWKSDAIEYVPNPARYLLQEKWEDENYLVKE